MSYIRNLDEEYKYLMENQSEEIIRQIDLMIKHEDKAAGRETTDEERKERISNILKFNLRGLALTNVINHVVEWINHQEENMERSRKIIKDYATEKGVIKEEDNGGKEKVEKDDLTQEWEKQSTPTD